MKKQSGFTLIELMVVMAIIAILATAGLSAYTGYIKKARDTTRIADVAALNTIVLGQLSVTGKAPVGAADVAATASAANNGSAIADPLTTKSVCMNAAGDTFGSACEYYYKVCDSGTGYAIATRFESFANLGLYTSDSIGTGDAQYYEAGSCQTPCTASNTPVGCPTVVGGVPVTPWTYVKI